MTPLRMWILTSVFLEVAVICALVALPVYWVRTSNLRRHDAPHLVWKLIACAFFFGLGAVSGLRWWREGMGAPGIDWMTAWFLPLVGVVYLHVGITHCFRKTLDITLFFLLVSYPAATLRAKLADVALSMPGQ